MDSRQVDPDALMRAGALAEYAAMRAEVLQLNAQIITIFAAALTLNATVLGWMFSKDDPAKYYALPTVGVVFLALGSAVVTSRWRLAHRLGLFQKHFMEPRLPGICWATVYFSYRERLQLEKGIAVWGERLTESGFLLGVGGINLLLLAYIGLQGCWTAPSVRVDWQQVLNFAVATGVMAGGWALRSRFRDYTAMERIFRDLASEPGSSQSSRGADTASPALPAE